MFHLGYIFTLMFVGALISYFYRNFRGPRQIGLNFSALALSVSFWSAFRYSAAIAGDGLLANIYIRIALFIAAFSPYFLYRLVCCYCSAGEFACSKRKLALILSAASALAVVSPWGVAGIVEHDDLLVSASFGVGGILFALNTMFWHFVSLVLALYGQSKFRKKKDRKRVLALLLMVAVGYSANLIINIVTSLLNIDHAGLATALEAPLMLAGVCLFICGVVKYGVFNVRELALQLSLFIRVGIGAITWATMLFIIAQWIPDGIHRTSTGMIVYLLMMTLFVMVSPLVTEHVAKIFERTYYKTDYELDDLLTSLDRRLMACQSINSVGMNTCGLLAEGLGAEFSEIYFCSDKECRSYVLMRSGRVEKRRKSDCTHALLGNSVSLSDSGRDLVVSQKINSSHSVLLAFGKKTNLSEFSTKDQELVAAALGSISIAFARAVDTESYQADLHTQIAVATNDLQKLNKQLKKADSAKNEFISMASHQLRTPLTVSRNYVSLLKDGRIGNPDEAQGPALEQTHESLVKMTKLIEELLVSAQVNKGKLKLAKSSFDFKELVEQEIESLRGEASKQGVIVEPTLPKDSVEIYGDKQRLADVVSNLIDNALKYSNNNGRVAVGLRYDQSLNSVEFEVKDDGIGIKASDMPKMFRRYARSSNARQKRPGGTGLGLYIAKKVVDLHGGNIRLVSRLNKGTTIGFSLPVGR